VIEAHGGTITFKSPEAREHSSLWNYPFKPRTPRKKMNQFHQKTKDDESRGTPSETQTTHIQLNPPKPYGHQIIQN
jgi:hypothetical protein